MTWNRKYDQVGNLYKKINLLKLNDIYKLELSKFMHQLLSRDETPPVFDNNFFIVKQSHSYDTRQLKRNTYFLPRVSKSIVHNYLAVRGSKLWVTLDESLKTQQCIYR